MKRMSHMLYRLFTVALSLAPAFCCAAEPGTDQARAIAAVRKSGCEVTIDEASSDKPVIDVVFSIADHDPDDPKPNDAALRASKSSSDCRC